MTPLRTFPLRTAPRPGESLDSWLEAAAVRLRVTMAELYEAMGFASPHSELWRHIVLRPTDTELAAISATTGLAPGQVRAMTLSRYAGIAVGIDSDTGRFAPTTPWGRVHGSRFCPHCLRATGGAWKLQWRLIWTFACLSIAVCWPTSAPTAVGRNATATASAPNLRVSGGVTTRRRWKRLQGSICDAEPPSRKPA